MVTPSYAIRCLRKTLVAPNVYELVFEKPTGFTFKAGQFVLFDVPLLSDPTDIQPRAYSIASSPNEPALLFVVKMKQGGRFSDWLEGKIEAGTTMNIKGPFGLFALKDEPIDIVFAATGAGIAPFRSQILDMIDKKSTREIHLFFGARTPKDFFWTEELRTLERKHPNIHVHLCLSRDDPSWTGHRGRVQQFIPAVIKDPLTTQIYICGAPEMVGDIKKVAIETWGMPKANVHAEGYI